MAFISHFTGSAGTAVVPLEGKAALWTDGRYFLQVWDLFLLVFNKQKCVHFILLVNGGAGREAAGQKLGSHEGQTA